MTTTRNSTETAAYWIQMYRFAQASRITASPATVLGWAQRDGYDPQDIEDALYDGTDDVA